MDHADLLIAGGGPVGATLALALKDSGLSIAVLEARADFAAKPDPRTLALSYGSMLVLRRLGVWDSLPAPTQIVTIHVSQQGGLGRTLLTAADAGLPALGYVVNYAALDLALHEALQGSGAHYLTGATVQKTGATRSYAVADFDHQGRPAQMTARLLALADGGRSLAQGAGFTRHVRDYGQSAVVAQVSTELPHRNMAFERFTPDGPAALLPAGEGFALVWTCAPDAAQALCELDDAAFLAKLHAHFGDRLGRFTSAGRRASFPLSLRYTRPVTGERTVLLGNAAQMLHPVAGQGFNLGLRDAWELGAEILAAPGEIGSAAMLARYRARRRVDTGGGILFTDALVRGFSNDIAPLRHARGAALAALDLLPPLKRLVVRKMIYGARG
jgi:2-octaprenyl-6-methoxyphenol hydroxylase